MIRWVGMLLFCSLALCAPAVTLKTLDNGDDTLTQRFYQGKKLVAIRTWDSSGDLMTQSGKVPDGIAREYDKSGDIVRSVTYRKGKRHGEYLEYNEEGEVRQRCYYKEDKLNGKLREYNDEGGIIREEIYRQGERDEQLYFMKDFYKKNRSRD